MTLYTLPPYSGMSVELSTPEQRADIYGRLYDLGKVWDPIQREYEVKDAEEFGFFRAPNGKFICNFSDVDFNHIPYEQWLEMLGANR